MHREFKPDVYMPTNIKIQNSKVKSKKKILDLKSPREQIDPHHNNKIIAKYQEIIQNKIYDLRVSIKVDHKGFQK
jgi:hypothetical protein